MEDSDPMYPWRAHEGGRRSNAWLPRIPGVCGLSRLEIKRDIQEMEQAINSDIDSDSSTMTEDVLVSTYPVKPRKTPKGPPTPIKHSVPRPMDIEPVSNIYDGVSEEQTMQFLDFISRSNSDIYAAECERELLESQAVSYQTSIEETSKRFLQLKRDQSNYVRTIQGYHSQALRLQMGLKRQNAMFYDVFTSLQRGKKASESMKSYTDSLRTTLASASIDGATSDKRTTPIETAVLKIRLSKTDREAVLYKGQCIATPMGNAQITSIRPSEEKIVLQLPYGQLYSSIRQVVIWGGSRTLLQTDELLYSGSLRNRWQTLHRTGGLFLPSDVTMGIKALVGQGEDELATDGDSDSANEEMSQKESINCHNETDCNGSTAIKCEESVASQDDALRSVECITDESGASLTTVPTSISSSSSLSGIKLEGPESVYSFPLKVQESSTSSTLSRNALKTLFSSNCHSLAAQDSCSSGPFPLIFAPPACLPYLLEEGQRIEQPKVTFCPSALAEGGQPGSAGSITWNGDIMKMARELIELQEEVNVLEREQNHFVANIQSVRSQCIQLCSSTAAVRLGTYTRRMRHRTNLIRLDNAGAKISLNGQYGEQGGVTSSSRTPYPDLSTATVPQVEVIESVSTTMHRTRSGSGTSEVEVEGGEEGRRIPKGPVPAVKGISGPGSRSGSRSYGVVFSGAFLGTTGKETKTTPVPATSPSVSHSPTLIPSLRVDSPMTVVEGNGRKRVRDVPAEIQAIAKKRGGAVIVAIIPEVESQVQDPPKSVKGLTHSVSMCLEYQECSDDVDASVSPTEDSGDVDKSVSLVKGIIAKTVSLRKKPKRTRRY